MTAAAGTAVEVRGLKTHFRTDHGLVRAVDGVDLTLRSGRTLCVVGESGCGKSITARSLMQLIDPPGRIEAGEVLLHRPSPAGSGSEVVDIAKLGPKGRGIRDIRGNDIAMVFQEPMTSLSPVHTVGNQMVEAIRVHIRTSKQDARGRSVDLLGRVGIPNPDRTVDAYPFQLSGGMRQRVMIAMALACEPAVLVADEPTTALDVTTQAQIMDLLRSLQDELGMAIMFITHDMGVVAEIADEVAVMYLGTVVEQAPVDDIFHNPLHPYTRALLESIPGFARAAHRRLPSIRGMVPDPYNRPAGCPFHPRCDAFMPGKCDAQPPPQTVLDGGRRVRCLLHGDGRPAPEHAEPAPGSGHAR